MGTKNIQGELQINGSKVLSTEDQAILDTWYGGQEYINFNESESIEWTDQFAFKTSNNVAKHEGTIYHRVPIAAGQNVRFSLDEANNVVRINAEAGSSESNGTVVGTWILNKDITTAIDEINTEEDLQKWLNEDWGGEFSYPINAFTRDADGEKLTINYIACIKFSEGLSETAGINVYSEDDKLDYNENYGWGVQARRVVTFLEEPPSKVAVWLKANGVKQSGSGMPQIRFGNANLGFTRSSLPLSEENPLILTVEILGGGILKVGDILQACVRKTYWKKKSGEKLRKQRLRQFKQYVITYDDLNQRFLKITLDGTTPKEPNALFYNQSRQSTTMSPIYLRIKRITKYGADGDEANAIFSNVITVYKTYNMEKGTISIK